MYFHQLNKVSLSHLVLGNQRIGLRDKRDSEGNSASDTEAVTPGTDSFAAYGVQRQSVGTR